MRARTALGLAALLSLAACSYWTQHRLAGQWKTDVRPERALDLYEDGTYSLRLSGKGLGFVSELLGPETGSWRVEGDGLVLTHKGSDGVEASRKMPIREIHADEVVLADERWQRVRH